MSTKILQNKIKNESMHAKEWNTFKNLLKHAGYALRLSYSPYSSFKVGAAVLKKDGKIYLGANFENASYPLCLCAERSALAHAHSSSPKNDVIAIAVVCKNEKTKREQIVSPCGACRQVINEFEDLQKKPIKIILGTADGKSIQVIHSIKELLPLSFDASLLV